MIRIAVAGALALALLSPAGAEDAPRCVAVSIPKGQFAQHDGGRWTLLTHEQWLFLEGVYALDPETPPGLPFGDRAVLATIPERDGGLIFFIDGDEACTPMAAPKALVELIDEIATGSIRRQPEGAL